MKVTERTREILAYRRDRRNNLADGWELIDEGGYLLGELRRGHRWNQKITDVKISMCGDELWVKVSK